MIRDNDQNNEPARQDGASDSAQNGRVTPDEVDGQELAACLLEVADVKDTCKRLAADFENYKKRVERDRVNWSQTARAELLKELLPVIDDFERALMAGSQESGQEQTRLHEGLELIKKAFDKFLQQAGVTVIESMNYFDPEFHEAVAHIDAPGHESGTIIDCLQKGYLLNGSLLRVARVTVAK